MPANVRMIILVIALAMTPIFFEYTVANGISHETTVIDDGALRLTVSEQGTIVIDNKVFDQLMWSSAEYSINITQPFWARS